MPLVTFSFFVLCSLFFAAPIRAITNPLQVPNNIYGIHIIDENDLEDAARLVNSNGGEWGYVTLVIREDERDKSKWQRTFDRMRELKLIPLVRLATRGAGENWEKPKTEEVDAWVDFLGSLNWVVQNRYVILFNEPNHAREWGGAINPGEYANIVRVFHDKLKVRSEDFFILPAGFDASAPNSGLTMELTRYWGKMFGKDAEVFKFFDGWSSHSYPSPAFRGSPTGSGKGSIKSFEWETGFLENYGLKKNIPIFITETGWVHKESIAENEGKKVLGHSSENVGNFLRQAFETAWKDPRITAVTPFVLNYQAPPFDNFSWKKLGSNEFYSQYQAMQSWPKEQGHPLQVQNSQLTSSEIPDKLVSDSAYSLTVSFKNTGQSIWDSVAGFSLTVSGPLKTESVIVDKFAGVRPGQTQTFKISFETDSKVGETDFIAVLAKNGKYFGEKFAKKVNLVAPPLAVITAEPLFKKEDKYSFWLKLYDGDILVEEFSDLKLDEHAKLNLQMFNTIPGSKYKFSFGKYPYLTRTLEVRLSDTTTELDFGKLIPLDFDESGNLGLGDLGEFVQHPIRSLQDVF